MLQITDFLHTTGLQEVAVTEERNVELKRASTFAFIVDHFLLPKVRLTYLHRILYLFYVIFQVSAKRFVVNIRFRFSSLRKYLFVYLLSPWKRRRLCFYLFRQSSVNRLSFLVFFYLLFVNIITSVRNKIETLFIVGGCLL